MKSHLSRNKAVTYDGFTEHWFLETPRFDLLSDLWN